MSLVASQLPLTREPRKECEAKDSAELAWIVKTVRLGAVKLRKSGKAVGSAVGSNPSVLRQGEFDVSECWWCEARGSAELTVKVSVERVVALWARRVG